MKIAYRGNFGVSFSTESHVAVSLERLGHEVVRIQERDAGWNETITACQRDADLFLWTSTYSFAQKWRRDEAEAIAQLNHTLTTAAFHLDLFFWLPRKQQVEQCGWFKVKHVCTADGDHEAEFKAAGVNHHWIRPAVLRNECYIGTPQDKFKSDLAFVGAHSSGYHPEYAGRMDLVRWLKQTYGERVRFWPESGRAIRGSDLNDLYASTKIAIGDSCFADKAKRYVSDRAYEAPGRGAFSLFPRIQCVEDELTDGEHCAFFEPGNFDDLRVKIEYWLARDDKRNAIRAAGCAHVRHHCSYVNRMEQMLDVIGLK